MISPIFLFLSIFMISGVNMSYQNVSSREEGYWFVRGLACLFAATYLRVSSLNQINGTGVRSSDRYTRWEKIFQEFGEFFFEVWKEHIPVVEIEFHGEWIRDLKDVSYK